MSDSHIQTSPHGGVTFVGEDAISVYRARQIKMGLRLARNGLRLTRGVSTRMLLDEVTKLSGKKYTRNQLEVAISDVETWCQAMEAALPIVRSEPVVTGAVAS